MEKTIRYHKLIRDKIPEIIESTGGRCRVEILDDAAYLTKLEEKLGEELAEYLQSKDLEELADLWEVVAALVKAKGYTWQELEAIREEKRQKRGGFEEKLLLLEVTREE